LGDLKVPEKRQAYLALGGQCWYVLGTNAKGTPIAEPDEVPPECGVMVDSDGKLLVARTAPKREARQLGFHIWMALAKAATIRGCEDYTNILKQIE